MEFLEEQEYKKQLDLSLWKKLMKFVVPYKKHFVILIIQMILIAGVDAIFPILNKLAIDKFVIPGSFKGFLPFCILLFVLITAQAVNVKFMIKVAGHIETGIPYDIRKAGFEKLQRLPLSYYDKTPVGWLMARMTSDVKRLGTTLSWNLVDMSWAMTLMFLMAVLMLILNLKLALLVLATIPALIIVSLVFQRLILKNYRKVRKVNSHITSSFNEGIMGAKTIKTLVREKESLNEFKELTLEMRKYSVRSAVMSSFYTPLVILLGSIGTAAIIWRGGNDVAAFGSISYGTLVAFLSYATQFFEPVKQFARIFSEIQYAQASAERIMTLIETEVDIKDSDKVISKYGNYKNPEMQKWPELKGEIEFRDVCFSYNKEEKILEKFNLSVKPGETIAIVGETGSGKTTIVNLACRFYEPTGGSILIDGIDYREKPLLWLYSNLGYVLQEPHLFSGTVRENIAYTRTDASMDEIMNAAKLVNAHDFITRLENGYDTDVGERGSKLSTGQKQLISFARAILANPKIFVLDEATSSVDTETEHLIKDAIQNILKGRTSFIIAHRLSTVKSADRILVIEKGNIIEDGTHKDLLRRKGYYYKLYTNQFIEEQENSVFSDEKAG
ncbi:MAG: ABC transporter ATP-binding protein/permease [Clostridia bacterium]|nr:ABC transporter ATP-binding protein/permease [Clostridia bacterium]